MKSWCAIGIFIVLVTGMVLMSGCISSASPGTEPAATPAPQVVIAPVLVTPSPTPTIAVPASTAPVAPLPTQIVYEAVFVTPTTIPTLFWPTTPLRDEDPEYNYNYLKPVSSAGGATGTLVIRVEGCSADGLTVFIARNGMNVSPLDNSYLLTRMVVEAENPVFLPVKILPDGSSEMERLAPGEYSAYLPNKDGDEIEDLQTFRIGANFMTYISLSGSSYSTPSSGCSGCSCRR
ncbi:MAG: hypothetical protein EHM53_03385 [Methanoregulaceae archaeon]|nr:MAG: hypothetical protein EHM53_03385 [Methanoregulaceae archaeon]